MVGFVYKLELRDQKYQTNENVRYENYNKQLSFTIREFLSLSKYHQ